MIPNRFGAALIVAGLVGLSLVGCSSSPDSSTAQRGIDLPEGPQAVGPTTFPGPSGGAFPVNVVRAMGGAFAGGIARLPDGHHLLVFQSALHPERTPAQGENHAFAMELGSDLMGPPIGDPVDITAQQPADVLPSQNVYDPGVAVTKDGTVLVSWYGYGIQIAKRTGADRYSSAAPVAGLAAGEGKGYYEVTIQTVDGHTLAVFAGPPDTQGRRDVLVQEVFSDLSTGPRVRVGGPQGPGPSGLQLRDTAAEAGDGKVILVWQQVDPQGGPRTIYGALSPDDGRTWGAPFQVASLASQRIDMFNPFVVNTGSELRVYSQSCSPTDCHITQTTSTDHGHTWTPARAVPLPSFTRFVGRPTYIVEQGEVYCFVDIARPGDTRQNPQVAGRVLMIFRMPD